MGGFYSGDKAHGRVQDGERYVFLLHSGRRIIVKGEVAMDSQEEPAGHLGPLRQLCFRCVSGHVSSEGLNIQALVTVPIATCKISGVLLCGGAVLCQPLLVPPASLPLIPVVSGLLKERAERIL